MFFTHFAKENYIPFFYKDRPSDSKGLRKLLKVSTVYPPKNNCCNGPVKHYNNSEPLKLKNVPSQ